MTAPRISIILPVYNQADHIAGIITRYLGALDQAKLSFELIVIVNGRQRDQSVRACRQVADLDTRVRLEVIEEGGWGRAVRHGLALSRGEIVCYTNSARTSSNDLILCLIYAVAYPNTVIAASRKIRESVRRRLGSVIYNFECRTFFDLATWDINGTPKIFPRTCEKLLHLERNDDLIDLEFHIVADRAGYQLVEIPIVAKTRHGGTSTTNLRSAWKMYIGALQIARSLEKQK